MAKNLGREFATMSEDERRKFALEAGDAADAPAAHDRMVERQRARRQERTTLMSQGADIVSTERQLGRREASAEERGVNVGGLERIISGVVGVAVALAALRSRRLRRFALPLSGGLLSRAITGRCPVNRALGRNIARRDTVSPVASIGRGEGIRVEKSVTVRRPREELFRFWRNFENLPRFMDHLESVTVIDERRSHWVAGGPAGTRVEWDAEIHNEIPNELIAWRTLPGSEVDHAGSVHFESSFPGPATTVRVVLRYEPPAGRAGAIVASLFGKEPSQQIEDDLRRFRQVIEAGQTTPAHGG